MGNIEVSASTVLASSGAVVQSGTAGGGVTAGQPIYKDTSDENEYKAASATSSTASIVAGIALNGAGDGQPVDFITHGNLNPGGTTAAGTIYCLSTDAGRIFTSTDVATSGTYVSVLGIGTATNNIKIEIVNSKAQLP